MLTTYGNKVHVQVQVQKVQIFPLDIYFFLTTILKDIFSELVLLCSLAKEKKSAKISVNCPLLLFFP